MQRIWNIQFAFLLSAWSLLFYLPQPVRSADLQGQLYSSGSGLSQSVVTSILQDSLGFLWVGTNEGLNKYDGYTFEQFRYQPDTISLSSNAIRCLAEGRDGVIWVGTDFGLNKLDRRMGNLWTHYLPEPADSAGSRSQLIYSMYVDRRGQVWTRTEHAIAVLDPEEGEFIHYELFHDDKDSPDMDEAYNMQMGPRGNLWIGSKDGLQVLNPRTGDLIRYTVSGFYGLRSNRVRVVFFDGEGRIWCGTDRGLYLSSRDQVRFKEAGEILPELVGLDVLSILENGEGDLFVGTRESLVKIRGDLSGAQVYERFYRPDIHTRFTNINALYEDGSRILWLGTSAGLVKIDQKKRKFDLINTLNPDWVGLSSNVVSSIFEDENGDLWIGTNGMGLNLFKTGSGRAIQFNTHAAASRRLVNDQIHCITRDRKGNLWLGTGNGVSVMKPGMDRFYPFCSGEARDLCELFDRQSVYDVFEDSKGFIWFAASNGIHRYNPADRTILKMQRIHYGTELLELQDVYCVTEDPTGRIWIGSSVGLIRYSPLQNRFEIFQAGKLDRISNINSNTVFSLHTGKSGELWIGTASGLNRYDPGTDRFEFFSDPVELTELRIFGILEDGRGNLWLSSDRGIAMYEPKLETFIQYGPPEGLQNNEFIPGSSFRNTDGRMYFGGIAGLNTFHPDSIQYNPYPPKLSFTQFVRFREQGGMSKPLALDRVSKVIVPRGVEIVTIRFSALEFTNPERNRYMYKMVRKGQDGLWIHNREQNFVTFYKLNPGTYSLSVKGSNNDLLYSDSEIQLEILVPYPFWNRSLAIFLYVLAGIIVIYLATQLRTRNLRRSNRMLRKKEISAKEIERQRAELARRNKSFTDSITYARRIQHALLPSDESFKSLLPDSFVLFIPKDIVSGDFYWINQHGNKIYVAAVDCTGHGVPGAFMSIIGFELFRKITASEQGSNPAMILDTLNENFSEIFSDGEQVYLNDGMDLSLCIIDRKEKSLDYSGAFNPLYLVRNETIIEVKADRFSVGADVHFSTDRKLFKSHKIYLQKDDIIYMFSDGFADQFGGPEGKKFKYRRFRHLLLTIHKLSMDKQKSILESSIQEWKGNIDQVDDILIIGFRP
jgi:ligand-binding sensor domain-containing protein/serine phosphatase RsbU (regulator of sigma subunit)